MSYQHILIAVDLTEECNNVIQRAQAVASSTQARLSIVHIIEPMAMAFGGDVPMDLSIIQQQQFEQQREDTAPWRQSGGAHRGCAPRTPRPSGRGGGAPEPS